MKDVSIIIVNYNTSALIKNLLDSLYEKTEGISYEVIIVDNKPTEQFAIDLKDYLDRIIYLPLKENVGFGRANNEGLKIAKGRNIFF
jgi:GT2 family glycosyltransferase